LPEGARKPKGSDTLVKAYFLPNADVANALGYHDVDPEGDPYIRVFTLTVLQNGGSALSGPVSISSCASHEACEEGVDPSCAATSTAPDGDVWALEVCDPVESTSYNVTTQDGTVVAVSDFVTPGFFAPATAGGSYDYCHVLASPYTIAKGGYAVINEKQVFGEAYPAWRKATKASPVARTYRRLHPHVVI
jgi:hypothetical protein